MASAIAQQVQALLPDQPISYPRATVDYIPKALIPSCLSTTHL